MAMRWNGNGARVPRLLIADSQPLFADALAALVSARGYDVHARAHDDCGVVTALRDQDIDIVVIAADLVTDTVVATVAALRRSGNLVALVATAGGPDEPAVDALLGDASDGLVLKDGSSEWLFHCLASVNTGGQWHDPRAVAGRRARRDIMLGANVLTRREAEIARHVAGGRRNRDIAETLGISEGTVKMHLHNAYAKLGVESRTQLAMDARVRTLA
jgi:two-component system nitrate/nitrite response regulator NarL